MRLLGKRLKKVDWKLTVLLALSLATMLIYGDQKEGYHVDEVYSYGLANSEYLPFMHFGTHDYDVKDWMLEYGAGESLNEMFDNFLKDFQILQDCGFQVKESVIYQDYLKARANSADTRTTAWVPGQDYMDYLAASPSNAFNYASVYYNQRGDVHPPLYYILLHTICSVFQGSFSKWFGLGLNIAVLLLTLVLLYRMCRLYLGGEWVAVLATGVYGVSVGFVSTALFVRMYALLTLMTVACCYVHLKIAHEDFKLKGANRRKLALVVLGGFLTHYYFVLYAIGVAAVFCVWMFVRGKRRQIISYILTLAGTAVMGLCIWPFALKHVFFGYRGAESLNVLREGQFYFIKIKLMFDQVAGWLLGGRRWILLLCLCALSVLFIRGSAKAFAAVKNTAQAEEFSRAFFVAAKGGLVVAPIVFYTVVVAQIVPFLTTRYFMCTYPFWYLFVLGTAKLAVRACPIRKKEAEKDDSAEAGKIKLWGKSTAGWQNAALAAVGAGLFAVSGVYWQTPDNLNPGGQDTVEIPENTDCVFVLADGDWNQSAVDSTILAQCVNVGVTYLSDVELLAEGYEYQDGNYLMISIQKDMDIEAVFAQVKEVFGVEDLSEVDRQVGSSCVRILLTR